MTEPATAAGIGQAVRRKEDVRLVMVNGRFSDDINLEHQAHAAMVRSPHAHARIRSIDIAAAVAMPGVIAVLTGADAAKDGLKPIPHRPVIGAPDIVLGARDASDKFISPHRVLPHDKARYVSDVLAVVGAKRITVH